MDIRYEDKIKMAFEMQCDSISASGALKQKIDEEIRRQGKIIPISPTGMEKVKASGEALVCMEDNTMKRSEQKQVHFNAKKLVIGVAAACLLLSGAAFAGKTAMYISGNILGTYTYEELDKAEEKLEFEVDLVENFSNGYSFQDMQVQEVRGADENHDTLYTFPELDVDYARDGVQDINLFAEQRPEKGEEEKEPDMTEQCGDITLRYDVVSYKFVPVDYELTEEDLANMERDDYEISVGTDEVEYREVSSVTWEKDGTYYHLMGMDTALSGEEMFAMAKELIGAE